LNVGSIQTADENNNLRGLQMKDSDVHRIIQRRKNKLDKSRDFLQRQIEKLNDESSITDILLQIQSNDRERCLLTKIGEGAAL